MPLNARPLLAPMLVLALAGGAVAWLVIAEPPTEPEPARTIPAGFERLRTNPEGFAQADTDTSGFGETNSTSADAVPLPNDIRNVSPNGVSAPVVTAPLTRIKPSERYLELKNPPIQPLPDGPIELKRPQVADAGTLRTKDLTVRIAHIKALAGDETCISRLGGTWPCGARARTSLRGLIRVFTVRCEKVADLGPREVSAVCSRRNTDIGAWLVEYGWADPVDGAPDTYKKLAQAAKDKKIGKWQAEWLELPLEAKDLTETPGIDLEALLPEGSDPESWLGQTTSANPFDLPLENEDASGFGEGPSTIERDLLQPLQGPE